MSPELTAQAEIVAVLARMADTLDRIEQKLDAGAPEGLDANAYAVLIGVSRSKIHELNSAGLIPSPIDVGLGRCPRWSRQEVLAHFRAGMPSRGQWQVMKAQAMRRAG